MTKPMSPGELRAAFEVVGLGIAKLGEEMEATLKSQPGVADVHVSTTGKKPKPPVAEDDDAGSDHRPLPDGELDKAFEAELAKYNENHDDKGQFSSGGGGGSGGGGTGYSASMSGKSNDELQFIMSRAKDIASKPGNRGAKAIQAAVSMGAAAAAEVSRRKMGKSADWEMDFAVTKADAEQRKVWGWASISQVGAEIIIDKQGDIIPIVELEKGAYDFMLFARDMGVMHEKTGVGKPFESMVFTPEKAQLGIVAKNEAGKNIYGWWCGWQIEDDGMWAGYKDGKFPEFSIGGRSSFTEQA